MKQVKRKNLSCFNFTPEDPEEFKALIISDLHIGQFHSRDIAMQEIVRKLREICEMQRPSVIFILGDIIHINVFNFSSYWTRFYSELEQIGVEIHIIPGNHDRWKHWAISYRGSHVTSHNNDLIVVTHGNLKAVLGHDLRNDRKVHSTELVRQWYQSLRDVFSDIIDPDALMILGHLHQITDSKDHKTRSILPFSYDLRSWSYATLEISEGEFRFARHS